MWFDTYSAAKWRQVYDWPPDRRLFLLGDVPRKLPIENTRVHKTFIVVITICFGGKYVFGNILAMLIENKFLFSKKCFFWDNEQMKIENPSLFYSVTKANASDIFWVSFRYVHLQVEIGLKNLKIIFLYLYFIPK